MFIRACTEGAGANDALDRARGRLARGAVTDVEHEQELFACREELAAAQKGFPVRLIGKRGTAARNMRVVRANRVRVLEQKDVDVADEVVPLAGRRPIGGPVRDRARGLGPSFTERAMVVVEGEEFKPRPGEIGRERVRNFITEAAG